GGDLNVFNMLAQTKAFQNFQAAKFVPGTGTPDYKTFTASMVRYTVGNQGRQLLPANDPCLGNPRDFVFYDSGLPKVVKNFKSVIGNFVTTLQQDTTLMIQKNPIINKYVIDAITDFLKGKSPALPVEKPVAQKLLATFQNVVQFPDN